MSLAQIVTERWDLFEADLERYFQKQLAEELAKGNLRKLWVWFQGLPPDAAVHRVEGQQWTTLHELLAINAEVMDQWGLIGVRMRAKHPEQLPKESLRIPRPGVPQVKPEPKNEVMTSPEAIKSFFG